MKRRGGFPAGKFCNQARSESYLCRICFDVCRSPVTCQSGAHLFCHGCLSESLRRNSSCPACREPLTAPVPSAFAAAQVSALDVMCVHDKCKWKGTCGRLDSHLDTDCPHEPIKCSGEGGCGELVPRGELATHQQFVCLQSCPNSKAKAKRSDGDEHSCDVRLSRCDLVDHLQNHCKLRIIHCPHPWCELFTAYNQMPAHLEVCPYAPVPCPRQCCAVDLIRQRLEAHKRECPNELVPCIHAPLGCSHVAPRGQIVRHERDFELHFRSLSKLYVEQEQQIRQMKLAFEELFQAQAAVFQQELQGQTARFEEKLQIMSTLVQPAHELSSPLAVQQAPVSAATKQARSLSDARAKAGQEVAPLALGLKCYSCGKPATVFFWNNKEPQRNDSYCKNGVSGTCSAYSHMYYGTTQWGHAMSKSEHVELILRAK